MNLAYNEGWHAFQMMGDENKEIQDERGNLLIQAISKRPCEFLSYFINGWDAAYRLHQSWKG